MSTIRLLLADDHTLVRAGIRMLVQSFDGMEVVAETGEGREIEALVRRHRPDVVLMDITMPGLSGLDATARVLRAAPKARVIILSMHANEEYVLQALRSGAAGYLLKDAATVELQIAIRAVVRGETYLSTAVSKRVIDDYLGRVTEQRSALEQLTARQREILQLIAEGRTTREIAKLLQVSVKTVESHRQQLMVRLNIRDVAGLVRYAVRLGLVAPD